MDRLVILLTGASSGIGYEAARLLAEKGHKVYGAARRTERIEPLRQYGVTPVALNVTSDASAKEAVDFVVASANDRVVPVVRDSTINVIVPC